MNSAISDLAAVIGNMITKADTQNTVTRGGYQPKLSLGDPTACA
jgi:hypothetical protein